MNSLRLFFFHSIRFVVWSSIIIPFTHNFPTNLNNINNSNYSLSFDGIQTYVKISDSPTLLPINQMTVEVWVKPNDVFLDIDRAIVTKTEGGSFNLALNHWSRTSNGRFSYNLYSSTDYNSVESSEHTGINTWFHIAGTFDGNLMKIYVDGQLEGTQNNPGTIASSSVPMLFGAEPQEGLIISHFKGQIDEIRIWNYARTGEEIMHFMHSALKGNEPGLVRYWNFDEGSGQVVHDIVGNHNGQLGELDSPDTFDPTWSLDSAPVYIKVFLPIVYKSP